MFEGNSVFSSTTRLLIVSMSFFVTSPFRNFYNSLPHSKSCLNLCNPFNSIKQLILFLKIGHSCSYTGFLFSPTGSNCQKTILMPSNGLVYFFLQFLNLLSILSKSILSANDISSIIIKRTVCHNSICSGFTVL